MMRFDPYQLLMDFALISALLFVAQLVRARVKWVQRLHVPAAMIAGFLGLFLGKSLLGHVSEEAARYAIPFSEAISNYPYMLIIALFGTLFLGNRSADTPQAMVTKIGDTFLLNMAAELGGFGFALLVGGGLLVLFLPHMSSSFALLQPAGFVGGFGYAAAIGTSLQEAPNSIWHGQDAVTIGQTFATIGLLASIFGGLAAINYATRHGYTRFITSVGELPEEMRTGLIREENQLSIGKATISSASIDPLTWHVLLVLITVAGGYYSYDLARRLWPGVVLPMFCLSMLTGVVLQSLIKRLGMQQYVDKQVMTRIGGVATDYLVAFGIASINISVVLNFLVPLILMATLGIAFVFFYLFVVCKRLFQNHWFERGIFIFGWALGVVAMSVTLLRIVDPNFRSRTLEDYGMAYVVISMVEIAIVALTPPIVALGFADNNFWYTLVPGAVMLGLAVALVIATAMRYGVQSRDGAARRRGETAL
jgi:ESS family glutamate:Na+ symporter